MLGRMEYFSVSVCYILWSRRQTLVLCPLWGDPGLCMGLIQRACRLENITILSVLSSWSRSKHTSLLGFTFFIELRWVNYVLYVRMSICLHFLRCYSAFFFISIEAFFTTPNLQGFATVACDQCCTRNNMTFFLVTIYLTSYAYSFLGGT